MSLSPSVEGTPSTPTGTPSTTVWLGPRNCRQTSSPPTTHPDLVSTLTSPVLGHYPPRPPLLVPPPRPVVDRSYWPERRESPVLRVLGPVSDTVQGDTPPILLTRLVSTPPSGPPSPHPLNLLGLRSRVSGTLGSNSVPCRSTVSLPLRERSRRVSSTPRDPVRLRDPRVDPSLDGTPSPTLTAVNRCRALPSDPLHLLSCLPTPRDRPQTGLPSHPR